MTDKPERACILLAKITADDRQSMVRHLEQLARDIDRGELGITSVSGGYSSGHIVSYAENSSPSHDQYFTDLNAHLGAIDGEGPQR